MFGRPSSAERSVFLDYDSPLPPVALVKAIKNVHMAVIAAIIRSLLLTAVIVVSTGLITLSFEPVQKTGVKAYTTGSFVDDSSLLQNIGSGAYENTLGIPLAHSMYLDRTTIQYAFPMFNTIEDQHQYSVSGTMDTFSAGLVCEPAEHEIQNLYFDYQILPRESVVPHSLLTVRTPECTSNYSFNHMLRARDDRTLTEYTYPVLNFKISPLTLGSAQDIMYSIRSIAAVHPIHLRSVYY